MDSGTTGFHSLKRNSGYLVVSPRDINTAALSTFSLLPSTPLLWSHPLKTRLSHALEKLIDKLVTRMFDWELVN